MTDARRYEEAAFANEFAAVVRRLLLWRLGVVGLVALATVVLDISLSTSSALIALLVLYAPWTMFFADRVRRVGRVELGTVLVEIALLTLAVVPYGENGYRLLPALLLAPMGLGTIAAGRQIPITAGVAAGAALILAAPLAGHDLMVGLFMGVAYALVALQFELMVSVFARVRSKRGDRLARLEVGAEPVRWESELDGRLRSVTGPVLHQLGVTADQLVQGGLASVSHQEDQAALDLLPRSPGERLVREWRARRPDGAVVHLRDEVVCTLDGGRPIVTGRLTDVSDLATAADELVRQASKDSVTGLANREAMVRYLRRHLDADDSVSVLLIDIEGFREVNDLLGHNRGDELLRQVGTRLGALVEEHAALARIGGDDFALVIRRDPTTPDEAELAGQVLEVFRNPIPVAGSALRLGARVGAVRAPDDADQPGLLIARADVALAMAKRRKLQYHRYAPADEPDPRRLELAAGLRERELDEQLVVHYQPQLDLESGRFCGVEALVRWQHPTFGLLGPDAFVELSELTGTVSRLTGVVLGRCLADLRTWQQQGVELEASINVAVGELSEPDFVDRIMGPVRSAGIAPHRITVEVTETGDHELTDTAIAALESLRAVGIRASLDDFGTGHSSLVRLRRLAVSELKIDKQFVVGFGEGGPDDAVVTSLVALGRELGLIVVAEGVSSPEALEALRALGCHRAQGYLLSRPVGSDEIVPLVRSWSSTATVEADGVASPSAPE